MCKAHAAKFRLFILLTVVVLSGCAPGQYLPDLKKPKAEKKIKAAELPEKWELLNLYPDLKAQDFPKEIARLEAMLVHTEPSSRAKAHMRLGLLHLDSKNPNPNYAAAVKELEAYLTLDPKGEKKEEIQNLIQLLSELRKTAEENKKIKAKIDQLTLENQEIKKENIEVKKENQEIKKTVEELKSLDVNIEERRKQIK